MSSDDDFDLPSPFDDSEETSDYSDDYTSTDSDDFSSSSDSYHTKKSTKIATTKTTRPGRQRSSIDVEPLRFRDENPPTRWVGGLEAIDTEEAAYELRQQVTDNVMTTSTARFDPLEVLSDGDQLFATLLQQQQKENDRNTYRSMKRQSKDSEIDITSLHFDPVIFLSRIHRSTLHDKLESGILKLATTVAVRNNNIKKLVRLHFGQFVHCKDTIDLIQALLRSELPPEHQRLALLASRPHNLPFLLNTFTLKQQEEVYRILSKQFKKDKSLRLSSSNLAQFGSLAPHTLMTSTSPTTISSSVPSTALTGASGRYNPDAANTSTTTSTSSSLSSIPQEADRSRVGRLQLVLSTVADKTDSIYSPLLTRRGESDRIRQALLTFRKYKLLLELPMRMRQHITSGRVDRLVHDTQRIKQIKVSNNHNNALLFQALQECHSISFQYAMVLLNRLGDPRYNLYSQQRTMSYLYQLDNTLDPTWYYLERQTLHISNLLDRIYYEQNKDDGANTFVYVKDTPENRDDHGTFPTIHSRVSVDVASGGKYKYNDGEAGNDELDVDYNLFSSNSNFSHTVRGINQLAPPTTYFEYTGTRNQSKNRSKKERNSNVNDSNPPTHPSFHDAFGTEPLPLFLRKPRDLTHPQAELIATNLLYIFQFHIQPLLRLAYNVGNNSLFDTIKSALDGGVDISSLTLNKSHISKQNLQRLFTLISHITSKLIIYLSSLCIPQLNLYEIDGLMQSLTTAENDVKIQKKRSLDALDLAFSKDHPSNPINAFSGRGRIPSISTPTNNASAGAGFGVTSDNSTGESTPPFSSVQRKAPGGGSGSSTLNALPTPPLVYDDFMLPSIHHRKNMSPDFTPPTKEQLQLPFETRVGLNRLSALPPLDHSTTFGPGSNGVTGAAAGYKAPKIINFISSVTDDFVYIRQTPLHHVQLDPVHSVLPRHPEDPIRPIPVAPFSHVILHLLASTLVTLVNNELIKYEPSFIDSLLSFYCKLYQTSTQNLLISAAVQVTTLKESWLLSPQYIFSRSNLTTMPSSFQTIMDTYLQSMTMLPTKQLLFRGLLYLKSPPQFSLVADFTELVLTFADRLHSHAIPQWPVRIMDDDEQLDPEERAMRDEWLRRQEMLEKERKKQELIMTKTKEAVTTTKVITKKRVIIDGKEQVFETETILEEKPVTVTETQTLKADSSKGSVLSGELIDANTGMLITQQNKQITKDLTISRFGKEILSLAEQLNLNEHSEEPYSVSEVVSLNYRNIYQTQSEGENDDEDGMDKNSNTTALEQFNANQNQPRILKRHRKPEVSRSVAAANAGLVVLENGQNITKQFYLSHFNCPGEDRMILAVLTNTIYTTNTTIPRAWRNLADLIQKLWPAKELFEMSFWFSKNSTGGSGISITNNNNSSKLTSDQQSYRGKQALKAGLNEIKGRYHQREGTTYRIKNMFARKATSNVAPNTSSKRVTFGRGGSDSNSDESDFNLPQFSDTDESSTDDSSVISTSSDDDSDNDPNKAMNVLGISSDIWMSMSEQKRGYINASVVGGLGIAMASALDNSYQRVIGVFLWLQTILAKRYIHNKLRVIIHLMHQSLQCGGINWRKAPITTHVREFIYVIMQLLVESKSELLMYQNIDVQSIMTSIIEEMIIQWCYLVKQIKILSYNGAMQLYLETTFLCRCVNRYTTPYAISLSKQLLTLLHSYIEETILSERVNTTAYSQAFGEDGNGDKVDLQMYDAVSRLGMFTNLQKQVFGGNNANGTHKVDDNTGYEVSTTVSPLQSMLIQQRQQSMEIRAQRRSSNSVLGSSLSRQNSNGNRPGSGGGGRDLISSESLITTALLGDEKRTRTELQRARHQREKLREMYGDDFISSKRDSQSSKNDESNKKVRTIQQKSKMSSSDGSDEDNDDSESAISDTMYDDLDEDDEAELVAGLIPMKELKTYTTQDVNKDLMIQFKLHNSHIDIDNILTQSLWATRLSFATLRIDSEDVLSTLSIEEVADTVKQSIHTPVEVINGYFKVRRNASRLRENLRIERSESELQKQQFTKQWIKNHNYVFNTPLNNDEDELYVNLSLGQNKKYYELIQAQRSHQSNEVLEEIITRYNTTTTDTIYEEKDYSALMYQEKSSKVVTETMETPPEFGTKITRVITKRQEVVEKKKAPKEPKPEKPLKPPKEPKLPKEKKEKKQKAVKELKIEVEEVQVKLDEFDSTESEPEPTPLPLPKEITPPPSPVRPRTPTPQPIKPPTPQPTPRSNEPLIIEEQFIVTTTTTKEDQQIEQRLIEEKRRQDEKRLQIMQQYDSQTNNLDFLQQTPTAAATKKKQNDFDMNVNDELQAMNFSYKVKKREKRKQFDFDISSSESEPIPVNSSSSSSSEEELPPPPPKPIIIERKVQRQVQKPQVVEYEAETVHLQSAGRRQRERTNRRRSTTEESENVQIDLGIVQTSGKTGRAKKTDTSRYAEQQRLLAEQRQAEMNRKNTLKDKIHVEDVDMMATVREREREGQEDITKLTFEEKRRRQIKMRIKRTKDGKYIDLDTGEEIDPSLFKKHIPPS